jgi:hypothetical protein
MLLISISQTNDYGEIFPCPEQIVSYVLSFMLVNIHPCVAFLKILKIQQGG